jgi:hypothetical protein
MAFHRVYPCLIGLWVHVAQEHHQSASKTANFATLSLWTALQFGDSIATASAMFKRVKAVPKDAVLHDASLYISQSCSICNGSFGAFAYELPGAFANTYVCHCHPEPPDSQLVRMWDKQ